MVNVKEDITVFLGFKHTAAVQTTADNLKRLNQIILDVAEFKLADFFYSDVLENLGRITLNNLAVIVKMEGSEQGRMIADSDTHCLCHFAGIEHILVKPHHREQVVHC